MSTSKRYMLSDNHAVTLRVEHYRQGCYTLYYGVISFETVEHSSLSDDTKYVSYRSYPLDSKKYYMLEDETIRRASAKKDSAAMEQLEACFRRDNPNIVDYLKGQL